MKHLSFKSLGPGLIFAGAAIGVSHLVQSTRAGADFGFGLLWALLLVTLFKYPFFEFGMRYANATGESLLDGYKKLNKFILPLYFVITFATMFTIQAAVTIVTAGLAQQLFGDFMNTTVWAIVILFISVLILINGKYKLLDSLMKVIVITLTISTLIAAILSFFNYSRPFDFTQIIPENTIEIAFLIAFMGWMPAPLDCSIWQSLWTLEKQKLHPDFKGKSPLADFNIGYFATIIVGICFMSLGVFVMYNSGLEFGNSSTQFSAQLINLYTQSLGNWSFIIIAVAAFTTMFSTTLTTLDASPRAMFKTTQLLFSNKQINQYKIWLVVLTIGTCAIFIWLSSELLVLVKIATIISFLTAPFYAIINYWLITGKYTPKAHQPSGFMKILSWLGILFLAVFGIWYLTSIL
ncbi:divalent metal cation transporter [Paucihalobacter ruber]|uniref:Divalent metal cation transporter n=1 Tax=Paucihalobacter ruber TaxID=2567861 RepID=A0A506PP23_9FLAO|nr:Nramp family divalent metal transporter [Paucihalobacter ruber]TPV35666.1 divalent metal cation transporter [Paucihalobacter ruber]